MSRRPNTRFLALALASLALTVFATFPSGSFAANKVSKANGKSDKKPIQNPKFDPSAEQLDLFDAVDAGHVVVRLIPKDAKGGNVLIENKTDKPLTVKIPAAVVGVSIHAQIANFGMGNAFNGNGNGNAAGNRPGQQMQGGGVGQNVMNALGPAGQPNNGQQGQQFPQIPGNGLFSIPAEKTVSLPFHSVCLEHGKPEPNSNSKYTLVPVSKVSDDPVLYQLLAAVGTGKVNSQSAQAAAWHLTDKMSFQQLAEKTDSVIGALTQTPYFSRDQIQEAQHMLAQAEDRAAELRLADKSESTQQPASNVKTARRE